MSGIYDTLDVIYKVNTKFIKVMGYGASYKLKILQVITTNAPNPSYVNLLIWLLLSDRTITTVNITIVIFLLLLTRNHLRFQSL
jgi:hypothetical protein